MSVSKISVLNRALYWRCEATFKNVRIQNHGEQQVEVESLDLKSGKVIKKITHWGETYAVCCPLCNDTRFRCHINYKYGTNDVYGKAQTRLVVCYNGGCPLQQKTKDAYDRLEHMLCGHSLVSLRTVTVLPGRVSSTKAEPVDWPGEVVRLDKLPKEHPACQYLSQRNFKPDVIGRFWDVHWCTASTRAICANRLIIPIYRDNILVGWQARAAYDTDWKQSHSPKYYTAPGTPKSKILYNLKNAANYQTGIIVEGVTDAWRVGPQAVCTFGASISVAQKQLFVSAFRQHSGILLYDPDLKDKVLDNANNAIAELKSSLAGGFCGVTLPQGTDPGSLDRVFLRQYIVNEAAKQNVRVVWTRR